MNTNLPPLNDVEACIVYAHNINPKRQPLTIEKLRRFPGFEHYSDEEASGIIQSFEQLTAIIFEATVTGKDLCSSEGNL